MIQFGHSALWFFVQSVADVFCLCAHVCEGGRRRAGWFPPCSADLLATLGQVIPVIAAKAARRPNECLRRRQGAATCICLQASRQKNNTKLELDSRLDPIYVAAIFLQRHTQGWKLRLYVLKMYLCNFTASQVISNWRDDSFVHILRWNSIFDTSLADPS